MALTLRQFKEQFPAFINTDDSLIRAKLALALKRIQPDVWQDLVDDGQGYLAASLLSVAADGEKARLQQDTQVNVYQLEWERMKREVTFGFRTI